MSSSTTTSTSTAPVVDFWRGHPNPDLLPVTEMQEIMAKLTTEEQDLRTSLNYLKSDRGDPRLLTELRAFLKRQTIRDTFGVPTPTWTKDHHQEATKTDLFITHGVSHALELMCAAHTKPGDIVLVERPTYFLVRGIFLAHGLKVESLPMKKEQPSSGIDMDELERRLSLSSTKGEECVQVPRMVYIIPTHHNPTSRTMSIEDRWRLSDLSEKYGILVVADEVYHLLDWREESKHGLRPARMALLNGVIKERSDTRTRKGCCVSLSSFTKIFSPGIRCGWIEGPQDIIEPIVDLGYIQSQGSCAPFVGEICRISLSEQIGDRILERLTTTYQERSANLCGILQSHKGIEIDTVPCGGYFVWVKFLGVEDTDLFAKFCLQQRGLKVMPGSRCDIVDAGDVSTSCEWVRLCFADLDIEDLVVGARSLVESYEAYIGS